MKMVPLGAVATLVSGGTPSRAVPEYFGAGVPWSAIGDLNDRIVTDTKESLTTAGMANSAAKIVPAGSILVAMYGASIGKLGVAGSSLCTNQAIAAIQPKSGVLDDHYLFHFLLTEREHLRVRGRGGAQPNISLGDLQKWLIPLPPLDEQCRIAAILDHTDALRTLRRQGISRLDELAQSIFLSAFGHEPVDSYTAVADVCERITVGVVVKPASHYVSTGVPALRTLNVKPGSIDDSDIVYFSKEANNGHLSKSQLRTGDLVISRTGRAGVAAIVPSRLNGANAIDLIVVTPNPSKVNSVYFEALLNSPTGARLVAGEQRGQIQQHFNVGSLKSAMLPFPSLSRQRKFADAIEGLRASRRLSAAHLCELDELFASLQSRAFRGEL